MKIKLNPLKFGIALLLAIVVAFIFSRIAKPKIEVAAAIRLPKFSSDVASSFDRRDVLAGPMVIKDVFDQVAKTSMGAPTTGASSSIGTCFSGNYSVDIPRSPEANSIVLHVEGANGREAKKRLDDCYSFLRVYYGGAIENETKRLTKEILAANARAEEIESTLKAIYQKYRTPGQADLSALLIRSSLVTDLEKARSERRVLESKIEYLKTNELQILSSGSSDENASGIATTPGKKTIVLVGAIFGLIAYLLLEAFSAPSVKSIIARHAASGGS